jgi:hypothetical protein
MIRIGAKRLRGKTQRFSRREVLVLELERQVRQGREMATDCGSDWLSEPAFRSWSTVYNVPRA